MTKTCMTLLLILVLMFPGSVLADETRPMGRYVESSIELPEDVFVIKLSTADDGRPMVLGTSQMGLSTYVLDGSGWSKTGTIGTPMYWYPNDVAQREQVTYALTYREENNKFIPYVQRDRDGQFVDIHLDLGGTYPTKLELATNGRLLAQSPEGDLLVFDTKTDTLLERYDGIGGAMTLRGTAFFAVSLANRSVVQYDLETGELINEMMDAPITGGDLLASDGASLFLANSSGIYRITPGRTIWEQLIAGNLTSLCLPSIVLADTVLHTSMVVHDGTLYIMAERDEGHYLLQYRFDASANTLPLYELTIQTLRENPALTQAASVFQKQNPDYRVSISVLLFDGAGVSADDAIRALNTELLAGKGPDILLLDGMPISSYSEKGVLYDLSPLISELDQSGELVSSIFKPLYRDGKLYAAPTTCYLPVVMGKSESLKNAKTLSDLAELVNQSTAEAPLPWRTKQGYFSLFLPASYPAWFDANGQLNEAVFAEYLASIDSIYQRCGVDVSRPNEKAYLEKGVQKHGIRDLMDGNGGFIFDLPRLTDGRSIAFPFLLGGFVDARFEFTCLNDISGILSWLPGQAERIYAPCGMLGVNARGGQLDAALAFVRTALSQDVQGLNGNGGLPVNQRVMSSLAENDVNMNLGYSMGDPETGESLVLVATWPTKPVREQIGVMLSEANACYLPDNTLIHMIKGELASYFEGKMDAQSAAQAVSAKVRTYLSE